MKPLLFITFILALVACGRQTSPDEPFVKGFKYSAFLWHLSPDNDSFNFYLAHYLNVDKDGHFKLMRRDSFISKPAYVEGILPDTIRRMIDTIFAKDHFDTDYSRRLNDGFVYDGFTYRMDIRNSDSNDLKKIFFIPNKVPFRISQLATELDTFIHSINYKLVDTFDTYLYEEELKQHYLNKYGPLPRVHREQPKYGSVKTQK